VPNNLAAAEPTPISIRRPAPAPAPEAAIAEHRALAAKALDEAQTDMRYNRTAAASAWAAIAQAHLAFARELREDQ
jgi:hypothetical protein